MGDSMIRKDHKSRMKAGRTTGVVCTVLGGALGLWVVTRLSNAAGQMHDWAPPFAEYEWVTLAGAAVAVGLLIVGLVRLTAPRAPHVSEEAAVPKEAARLGEHEQPHTSSVTSKRR